MAIRTDDSPQREENTPPSSCRIELQRFKEAQVVFVVDCLAGIFASDSPDDHVAFEHIVAVISGFTLHACDGGSAVTASGLMYMGYKR